jgi:hypothetical protein
MSTLEGVDPTGPWHKMPWVWQLLGSGRRTVPDTALIHASVRERVAKDSGYAKRLPKAPKYVCNDWRTPQVKPVTPLPPQPQPNPQPMSELQVRINALTYEGDLDRGAQIAGNIYATGGGGQSRRDVRFPAGTQSVPPATFDVAAGHYVVEAILPSGMVLSEQAQVDAGGAVLVELDAADSPYESYAWQYLVGNVETSAAYHSDDTVPVPRSVGSRYEPTDVAAIGAPPRVFWCAGDADDGVGFSPLLDLADSDPAGLFYRFTNSPWVDELQWLEGPAVSDGMTNLYRFDSSGPPSVLSLSTRRRRFLLVEAESDQFVVTLPTPWIDVRHGLDAVVEVIVNARQSPMGNRIGVAVRDPAIGAGLAYLASGALSHAATLFEDVLGMLYDKVQNPPAAAAAGYVLVGTEITQDQTQWDPWIENLHNWFPWMSDGAILRAVRSLRTARSDADVDEARNRLLEAFDRGLPIFTLGLSWLVDALSEFPDDEACSAALDQVRRLSWRVDMREPFVVLRLGANR